MQCFFGTPTDKEKAFAYAKLFLIQGYFCYEVQTFEA